MLGNRKLMAVGEPRLFIIGIFVSFDGIFEVFVIFFFYVIEYNFKNLRNIYIRSGIDSFENLSGQKCSRRWKSFSPSFHLGE